MHVYNAGIAAEMGGMTFFVLNELSLKLTGYLFSATWWVHCGYIRGSQRKKQRESGLNRP